MDLEGDTSLPLERRTQLPVCYHCLPPTATGKSCSFLAMTEWNSQKLSQNNFVLPYGVSVRYLITDIEHKLKLHLPRHGTIAL